MACIGYSTVFRWTSRTLTQLKRISMNGKKKKKFFFACLGVLNKIVDYFSRIYLRLYTIYIPNGTIPINKQSK